MTQFIEFATPSTFWEKFFELHEKMSLHNAHLVQSHPFESTPITWPFLVRGVKYWEGQGNEQVYLLGNPFIWGSACYCGIITFAALYITTYFREHRGNFDFEMGENFTCLLVSFPPKASFLNVQNQENDFKALVCSFSWAGRSTTSPFSSWRGPFICITTFPPSSSPFC